MKSLIAISAIIVLTLFSSGFFSSANPYENADNEEGIHFFDKGFEEALAKAGKENKLVFLDIYASWCGPCKMMKRNTFPDKEVGNYFNSKFINIAMNGEKGEGPQVAAKYNVTGYPTLLFLNSQGEIVKKTMGYHKAEDILELAKTIK